VSTGLTFKLFGEDVSASDALNDVQDTAKKVAGGVAAAFAGGAIADAFGKAFDTEKSVARFTAGLGQTPEIAKRASDAAGRVFERGLGESLDQVLTAVGDIGTQMIDLGATGPKEVERLTEGALTLAEVMGVDVVEVTAAAGQMLRNDLAPNAMAAFDIIAAGAQNGANRSGDLLETFNEYAPVFSDLGISGEQALGMIKAGMDNGVFSTDLAADAFKEFGIRALDVLPSATGLATASADAMAQLGFDAQDMAAKIASGGPAAVTATGQIMTALGELTDPIARETIGVALFGTQWEDAGADAILAMNPVKIETQNIAGETVKMGDTLNNVATTKVEAMKRSFDGWVTSMVETEGWMGTVGTAAVAFGDDAISMAGSVGMIVVGLKVLGIGAAGAVMAAAAPLAFIAGIVGSIIVVVKTAMDHLGRMIGQAQAAARGDWATASSLRSPAATFGVGSWASPVSTSPLAYNAPKPTTSSTLRKMAVGGVVMPRAGGTDLNVAEAGEPEVIVPLSRWPEMTGGGGGGTVIVNVQGIVAGTADEFAQKVVDMLGMARRRGAIAPNGLTG
jgi:hypothetical protein